MILCHNCSNVESIHTCNLYNPFKYLLWEIPCYISVTFILPLLYTHPPLHSSSSSDLFPSKNIFTSRLECSYSTPGDLTACFLGVQARFSPGFPFRYSAKPLCGSQSVKSGLRRGLIGGYRPGSPLSAGVGRTGCFIVIDAMLERIKHEKSVDIYGHVTLMRSQRNYMVQTEDQYTFIHDSLQEAVTCGNTEVPARNLYAYIQKLTHAEHGENVTGMELEFKVRGQGEIRKECS